MKPTIFADASIGCLLVLQKEKKIKTPTLSKTESMGHPIRHRNSTCGGEILPIL
jgi:hypothetical protein